MTGSRQNFPRRLLESLTLTAMVAHFLASAFDQGFPRLGAILDIVKCFNALLRFPLLWMMIHLGINHD